ncbi:MAG: hypothetical protein ACI9K2_002242 [Myxococcota bacterium]|jgi:hypothetical protein
MRALFAALVLCPAAALAAPVLSGSGACPGPATLDVVAVTPGASVAFLHGSGPGSDTIPAGPCAGAPSGLSGLTYLTMVRDADRDGQVRLSPTLPLGAYARTLQALDATSCETSSLLDLGGLGGGGGGIVPGDTDSVVSFLGGDVFDPVRGVTDAFGVMEFRCSAWEGDVCTSMLTRNPADECGAYPNSDAWHTNLYVNSSESRNCALICLATTGTDAWDVCEGGDLNADAYWAYSWSQTGIECSVSKYLWRSQEVADQCDPYCLNIAHGTNYGGSPNLRLRCTDW